ncbi:Lar family restriction alleviation protein [Pseudomonas sp. Marseille-QA0332]
MPTENRSSNTEMVSELLPCPFCGQQDFLIERLDSDASVVICQGLTGPHEACLARGPVGVAQDEGEEQPGRDKAVELWNARAEQHRGEPVAWRVIGRRNVCVGPEYPGWAEGDASLRIEPLYTHADPAEVAQAKALAETAADQVVKLLAQLRDANDKLAERDALLGSALSMFYSINSRLLDFHAAKSERWCGYLDDALGGTKHQINEIENALSASAEPAQDANAGEVERLRANAKELTVDLAEALKQQCADMRTIDALRAQLDELVSAVRSINYGPAHAVQVPGDDEPCYAQRKEWIDWLLGLCVAASAEPSTPKCKGWTCFHCDEHFTNAEAASIHFGTHEIQRPACLIDAAEYRSMEARVREFANEDSELHRQMHRQANGHRLELRRAEESGYAKGLADASAPVERDELPPFAKKVLSKLRRTQECFEDSQGTDIGREWLDVLVKLGLLNRVQRSPALWEISDAGDELLEARAALERKP